MCQKLVLAEISFIVFLIERAAFAAAHVQLEQILDVFQTVLGTQRACLFPKFTM